MTDAGKAIYYILSNTSAVTTIVSTKIYPVVAPQETVAPFIVFSTISVDPQDTKDRPSSVDHVRMQIDCYGRTYASVEALHSAVRTAIDHNRGTHNGVVVDGLKYETENDAIEEDIDIFRRSADYIVRIKY